MPNIKQYTYEIEPLDLLFFRDGRPFAAGSQVRSVLPTPQGVTGALRTLLLETNGCDFDALANDTRHGCSFAEAAERQSPAVRGVADIRFRGPFFGWEGEPLLPVPACLLQPKGDKDDAELVRLAPMKKPPPGWQEANGLLPLWANAEGSLEPVSGFLCLEGLRQFLGGGVPKREHLVKPKDLYSHDTRVSVAIEPGTGRGADGQLFSVGFLALTKKTRLLVDVLVPDSSPVRLPERETVLLSLGGEGRKALLRRLPSRIPWPTPSAGRSGRCLRLLTTPALFPDPGGWRPPDLAPVAAAVPRPEAVSGWDMARRGPKPTRFAVPAGAVYFLESPAPALSGSLCAGEEAAAGWGHFIEGVWNYA